MGTQLCEAGFYRQSLWERRGQSEQTIRMPTVMFIRLAMGATAFLALAMQATYLDRAFAWSWLGSSTASGPQTMLDNSVVSVTVLVACIVATSSFLLWIARDRMNVEKRLDAGDASQKAADERHNALAEQVANITETIAETNRANAQRHNEIMEALKAR